MKNMIQPIVLFFFIVLCCHLTGCVGTSKNESLIYVDQIYVNHFDIAESINDSDEYYYVQKGTQNGTLYRYFLETGIQEIVEEEGVRIRNMYEEGAFVFYWKSVNDDDVLEEFWRYDKETEEKELLTIGKKQKYGFCQEYVWYEDELHTGYICPVNGSLQNDKIAIDSLFSKENRTGDEQMIRAYGMEICRYYSQTKQKYVLSYIKPANTTGMPAHEYEMETSINVDEKFLNIWRCNTDDGDTRFYFGYEKEEPWEIPCLRDSKYSRLSVEGRYVIENGTVIGLLKREIPKGHPILPYIKPEYYKYREVLISLNPATGESEMLYETEQYGAALSFGTEELEEELIGYREGRLYVIKNNKIYCISVSSKEEKELADMPAGEEFELTWRAGYLIIQEGAYPSHSQNDYHQILGVYKLEYDLAESMQE